MLKIVLISIGSIIAAILIIAAFMEKEYSISSEIIINRPKNIVFSFIKDIRNQEKYSKWVMADPKVNMIYTGTEGTVGFTTAWNSELKSVGVGEQEITQIFEGEELDMEIRFEKPFKMVSKAVTITQAVNENQTKYINKFFTKSPYPMNIMTPIMKKMLVKDMDETSWNLKNILEKN